MSAYVRHRPDSLINLPEYAVSYPNKAGTIRCHPDNLRVSKRVSIVGYPLYGTNGYEDPEHQVR